MLDSAVRTRSSEAETDRLGLTALLIRRIRSVTALPASNAVAVKETPRARITAADELEEIAVVVAAESKNVVSAVRDSDGAIVALTILASPSAYPSTQYSGST